MMSKRIHIVLLVLLLCKVHAIAQDIIFTAEDSIFIENILKRHIEKRYPTSGDAISAIANEFIGQSYIAGTLENNNEALFISCSKLDCTTFVETVISIYAAIKEQKTSFASVCQEIEKIRYRNGVRNGYTTRLHYVSWWIDDNKELVEEIVTKEHTAVQHLNLNYMSTHPENYPKLKENPQLRSVIANFETPYQGVEVKYIPKENISKLNDEVVHDGDIIAIVTAIEGLDISHLGFARWHGDELHMIHASSPKKEVTDDSEPLYNYLKKRKNHLGIRVIRIL